MNFSPLNVIMLAAGLVLIYAAIKDVNPKDVIANSLKGKPTTKTAPVAPGTPDPTQPPTPAVKPPPYPITSV